MIQAESSLKDLCTQQCPSFTYQVSDQQLIVEMNRESYKMSHQSWISHFNCARSSYTRIKVVLKRTIVCLNWIKIRMKGLIHCLKILKWVLQNHRWVEKIASGRQSYRKIQQHSQRSLFLESKTKTNLSKSIISDNRVLQRTLWSLMRVLVSQSHNRVTRTGISLHQLL